MCHASSKTPDNAMHTTTTVYVRDLSQLQTRHFRLSSTCGIFGEEAVEHYITERNITSILISGGKLIGYLIIVLIDRQYV